MQVISKGKKVKNHRVIEMMFIIGLSHYAFGAAPWYNVNWKCRQKITINRNAITGALINYPALIYFSNNYLLSNYSLSDGRDILFTSSNKITLLSFEIESYTNGNLAAWVRIPSLDSSQNSEIYIYFSNSGATVSYSSNTNVWDENFVLVSHMNLSNSTVYNDSSVHYNSGTNYGTLHAVTSGIVGNSAYFDKQSNKIQFERKSFLDIVSNASQAATFEAWYFTTNNIGYNSILDTKWALDNGAGSTGFFMGVVSGKPYFAAKATNSAIVTMAGTIDAYGPQWNYLAGIIDRPNGQLYLFLNVVSYGSVKDISTFGANIIPQYVPLQVGALGQGTTAFYNHFIGKIDELRISDTVRSSAYIKTTYSNLTDPLNFISVGNLETTETKALCTAPTVSYQGIRTIFSSITPKSVLTVTNALFIFADGTTTNSYGTNSNNPVEKIFTSIGAMTNWLIVTDDGTPPNTSSNSSIVQVVEYPLFADFLITPSPKPVIWQRLTFTDNSIFLASRITNWQISFGDGVTNTLRGLVDRHTVSHTYVKNGKYDVTLTIVCSNGITASKTTPLMVHDSNARSLRDIQKRVFNRDTDLPISFKYALKETEERVYLRILNLDGMCVRDLGVFNGWPGCDALFHWDGLDWKNYPVFSGPYLLRVIILDYEKKLDDFVQVIILW